MASLSGVPLPTNVAKAYISANLNSALLNMFLMGLYTMLYIATMCLYITKKVEKQRIIIFTTTALYCANLGSIIILWVFTSDTFVEHGEDRESVLRTSLIPSIGYILPYILFAYGAYMMADGLLVWRCYHIYGQSLRQVVMPVVLFITECVMCIIATIHRILTILPNNTLRIEKNCNVITGTANVVIALTSISATFMICRRVLEESEVNMPFRRRYMIIIYLLIESSMIYSLSMVALATIGFFNPGILNPTKGVPAFIAGYYINGFAQIASGVGPTLMVMQSILPFTYGIHQSLSRISSISELEFDNGSQMGNRNTDTTIVAVGRMEHNNEKV